MKVKKANVGMVAKKVREKEMMKASMGKVCYEAMVRLEHQAWAYKMRVYLQENL